MAEKEKITRESVREEERSGQTSQMRRLRGYQGKMMTVVAVIMAVFALLYIIHFFERIGAFLPQISYLSLMLAFILTLAFLLLPARSGGDKGKVPWYDFLIILIGIAGPLYNFFTWGVNSERYIYGHFYLFEIAFTFTTILAVLEATRRALGLAMPLVALAFLLHMFFGSAISGPFRTPPVRLSQISHMMIYVDMGVYGVALQTAATVIIAFIIFSQFMFATGVGDFFIKFALALVGHVRGGPAKVAIIASSLLGTITGATTANIAGTGVFTIPMMKRIGYKPTFAGAVETVASNGGQIMPPIMGLVAFVMAEWLGIPYWDIALASFLPAFLYFFAVFIMVDSEAGRLGLRGMPRSECPPVRSTLKEGWLFLIPILGVIFFLAQAFSPELSILYALGILLLLSIAKWAVRAARRGEWALPDATRSVGRVTLNGLRGGSLAMLMPGIACAAAGVIIGTLSVTQIGLVLSDAAVKLAGNSQFLLLVLAALACFILGMGMGSLPSYIMVVIIVAPALLKFGVAPLLTHLFVFWFALTSFITPPVAVGAYVAAGLAGSNPMRTAVVATRLGFCTFTLPFMFVYRPALLLQGSPLDIVVAALTALAGVALLSWGLGAFFLRRANLLQRLLFLAGGLSFIVMDYRLVLVGLVLGGLAVAWQVRDVLRERAAVRQQEPVPTQ